MTPVYRETDRDNLIAFLKSNPKSPK